DRRRTRRRRAACGAGVSRARDQHRRRLMPDDLAEPIRAYLHARAVGDVDTALGLGVDDVVFVDVDVVHRGLEETRAVLSRPIAARNLTFEILDVTKITDERYDVVNRIDGDLEGGPVDLCYRFFLRDSRIEVLVIERT